VGLICPKCADDMKASKAIEPKYYDDFGFRVYPISLTVDKINLIDVMKCIACGHSETEEENKND
jgi:hypothetical protein